MPNPVLEGRLPGLAPRSVRFLAGCVDAVPLVLLLGTFVVSLVPAFGLTAFGLLGQQGWGDRSMHLFAGGLSWVVLIVSGVLLAMLVLYQWFLLSTQGQTIGKRLFGIRIVDLEGRPAGFFRALLLRRWVFISLAMVISGVTGTLLPLLGTLVWWLDWVPLLGEDRRCLHDYLAGTQVRWVRIREVYVGRIATAVAGVGLVGLGVVGVMNRDAVVPLVSGWLQRPSAPVAVTAPPVTPTPARPTPATPDAPAPRAPEPNAPPVTPTQPPEPPTATAPPDAPPTPSAPENAVYQFTDDEGVVHATDDLGSVPEKYRARAKRL